MLIPPHIFAEDEITLENPCDTEVIFLFKAEKTLRKSARQPICLQKRQTECFLDDLRSKDMSNAKHYEWVFTRKIRMSLSLETLFTVGKNLRRKKENRT